MQVTLGDEGSGFSNPDPLFLPPVGNIGEAWPFLMLPLVLSLRLSDVEREIGGSRARPGLKIEDFDEIFMEEEERREVKQMKSSLVLVVVPVR